MNRFNRIIQKEYTLYKGGMLSKLLCIILNKLVRWYYHCDIPYSLNLNNVYFCHNGFGIVINPHARIGEGTYIQHGVTIGSRDDTNNINALILAKIAILGQKQQL